MAIRNMHLARYPTKCFFLLPKRGTFLFASLHNRSILFVANTQVKQVSCFPGVPQAEVNEAKIAVGTPFQCHDTDRSDGGEEFKVSKLQVRKPEYP